MQRRGGSSLAIPLMICRRVAKATIGFGLKIISQKGVILIVNQNLIPSGTILTCKIACAIKISLQTTVSIKSYHDIFSLESCTYILLSDSCSTIASCCLSDLRYASTCFMFYAIFLQLKHSSPGYS